MSRKKGAASVAAEAAEEPVKSSDRKFPYEVLKSNCMKLFHVTSSTFIGATAGMEGGTYSIAGVRAVIDSWLKKEVKN